MDQQDHLVRNISDAILGTATVTAPVWMQTVQTGTALLMCVGGVFLLGLRIAIAVREWRRGRQSK